MIKKKGLILTLFIVFSLAVFFGFNSDLKLVNATNHTNQTQTGSLSVQTNPTGANIFLDGVLKGQSPLTLENVAIGTHSVKAVKAGYQDAYVYPYVQAGITTSVYLTLQQQTEQGSIYVVTNPSPANIYLDEISQGLSPLAIFNVSVGNHTVKATKSGYLDAMQTVTVIANQQVTTSLTLQSTTNTTPTYYGDLGVTTNPLDAAIYLDGTFKGVTQFGTLWIYTIPVGSHTVKATKSGYQDAVQTVNIQTSTMTNITINLVPYTYSCSDTDNGKNYAVRGTATVTRSDGNITQTGTDFCNSNSPKSLTEYSCTTSGNTLSVTIFECKSKCKNGACPLVIPLANNLWVLVAVLAVVALLFVWKKKSKTTKKKRL